MTCSTCKGAGNLVVMHQGKLEWWPCPSCGCCGVRIQYGPPSIRIHSAKGTKP